MEIIKSIVLAFLVFSPSWLLSMELEFVTTNLLDGDRSSIDCDQVSKPQEVALTLTLADIGSASFSLCNVSSNSQTVEFSGLVVENHDNDITHSINLRYVKYWYQAEGAWDSHFRGGYKAMLVPELLLKDSDLVRVDQTTMRNYLRVGDRSSGTYVDVSHRQIKSSRDLRHAEEFQVADASIIQPISIGSGEMAHYWMNVDTSDLDAGEYRGYLLFTANNEELRLRFSLNILPYKLISSPITHSLYYRSVITPDQRSTISSEIKSTQQLREELLNIKKHGFTNPTVYQPIRSRKRWSNYSDQELAQSLDEYLSIRKELGFDGRKLFYAGLTTGAVTSEATIRGVVSSVKKVIEIALKHGYSEVYIYGSDEAKGEKLRSQERVWNAVKAVGGRIFVAGSKGHVRDMGRNTDLLIHRDEVSASERQLMHAHNNRIFKYHDPKSGPENPAIFRYKRGFYLWQNDFDGAMDYAYQHSTGFIWNDFDNRRYRDLAFTYPTKDGVIDTIAWEGYREAINDLHFLATLQYLVDHSVQTADVPPELLKDVKKFLKRLKVNSQLSPPVARRSIISHIEKLLRYARLPSELTK